jgi:hypothetical protein
VEHVTQLGSGMSLDASEAPARVDAWRELVEEALLDRERAAGGVRLTFRSEPGVAERLARLIELEGECCAWMSFTVRDEGHVIVDVTAEGEMGRRAVAEMFAVRRPPDGADVRLLDPL